MKKLIVFTLAVLLVISTVGCGRSAKYVADQAPPRAMPTDAKASEPPRGITVNTINFTEIPLEDASEEVKKFIEENKANRGYHFFEGQEGEITLVVLAGEKRTGGYDIKVQSVEDNEGRAVVVVKEISPAKDAMVTMALTYPVTIVKFKGTTTNFFVSDTEGKDFDAI